MVSAPTSVSLSLGNRAFKRARRASAGLPDAHTRNTKPFFSRYALFNSESSSSTALCKNARVGFLRQQEISIRKTSAKHVRMSRVGGGAAFDIPWHTK